jgi:hypothetical protein
MIASHPFEPLSPAPSISRDKVELRWRWQALDDQFSSDSKCCHKQMLQGGRLAANTRLRTSGFLRKRQDHRDYDADQNDGQQSSGPWQLVLHFIFEGSIITLGDI